ncbi:hypothetical protein [Sphingomonas abietis]|uniref:TetR family transcriptional regulator n=1 Tax=Sphingomonas abietis TaxID=3012344 RepID=A0ABY7NJ41_9SPHN|nr:hypothetical protein [Sphingomonas abietis]WBO21534.1 hypothetical protein PBT88_15295 [Sphingomonas abietis]
MPHRGRRAQIGAATPGIDRRRSQRRDGREIASILSEAIATRAFAADTDVGALNDRIHGAFRYRLLLDASVAG